MPSQGLRVRKKGLGVRKSRIEERESRIRGKSVEIFYFFLGRKAVTSLPKAMSSRTTEEEML